MAMAASPIEMKAAPRLRSRTTRSGSSGLCARRSMAANAVSSTAPAARTPMVVPLAQLVVCAWLKP